MFMLVNIFLFRGGRMGCSSRSTICLLKRERDEQVRQVEMNIKI